MNSGVKWTKRRGKRNNGPKISRETETALWLLLIGIVVVVAVIVAWGLSLAAR